MRKKRESKSSAKLSAGQGNVKKTSRKIKNIDIKEQYLKTSPPKCKVTFRLSKESVPEAKEVTIVGNFKDLNITELPMKKLKNGDFTLSLELPCNTGYRFRYLINTSSWENDSFAEKYIPGSYVCVASEAVIQKCTTRQSRRTVRSK
jgi:1,4-alpha-glucan branching enzyme